jgi:hypothetical protein
MGLQGTTEPSDIFFKRLARKYQEYHTNYHFYYITEHLLHINEYENEKIQRFFLLNVFSHLHLHFYFLSNLIDRMQPVDLHYLFMLQYF